MERKDRRASRSAQLRVTSAVPPRSRRPAFGAALGRVAAVAGMLLSASVGAQEGGAGQPSGSGSIRNVKSSREVGTSASSKTAKREIQEALPPFSTRRRLASSPWPSSGHLRQGNLDGAGRAIDAVIDASALAVMMAGWLAEPALLERACAGYSRPGWPSAADAGHRGRR